MRVIVACERSGRVREAFRALGHDAWSCDLDPAEDRSEHHFQCDVRLVLDRGWDLMIAHPDCTFLTVSGLHWNGRIEGRAAKTEEALEFVRLLLAQPIARIALENPVSCISSRIRRPDQIIQPFQFGEDASKKTCLWLKGLRPLLIDPAQRFRGRMVQHKGRLVERWSNQTDGGQNRLGPSAGRAMERARTYPGVAAAFAANWGAAA